MTNTENFALEWLDTMREIKDSRAFFLRERKATATEKQMFRLFYSKKASM